MLGTPSHPAINGMLPPKPSSWISIIGPWWPSGDVHSVSPERTCVRSGNMYNYSTHEYVHIYYVYNMVYIYTYLEMYISCLYIHRVYIYIWYMIYDMCVYYYILYAIICIYGPARRPPSVVLPPHPQRSTELGLLHWGTTYILYYAA